MILIMNEIHRKVSAKLVIGAKTYPIYVGVNTIGRNKNEIVTINNLNVSQHQALIVVIDETQHFISDLMSSNGTRMNTTQLVPFNLYQLKDSAEIVFGDLKATYLIVTSRSTIADSSQMNLTCSASQTHTQNFFPSNTQLIEHRQSDHTQSYISQESEGYLNELDTQEANYHLNITEKISKATPVHDYIFLKPKDRDNKQQGCTVKTKMTSGTADYQYVPVESLDIKTELIVHSESLNKQTDTENTEILAQGLLKNNYHNAPAQAIRNEIQTCDQQKKNPLTSNSSLFRDIPIQSIASEDPKESCNASLGKITPNDSSDVPIPSIASDDPKENSSLVFNLRATNIELESSHIETGKNVTAASTIPQNIFPLSRESPALCDTILCDESTINISQTSTSSGIGEQFVDDIIVHTNSDNNNGSIEFMNLSDDVFSMNRFFTSRKKSKMSKLKSDSISRVISASDLNDCSPIQNTKTIETLNSDSDSLIEDTQEIGYERKSLKKLNSDNSEPKNPCSETVCKNDLRKVKNSVGNKLDDSEYIPAIQDLFIITQPVHSKINPTCENVDNKALDGKELLISDAQQVKTINHSSDKSFKLGISEYIETIQKDLSEMPNETKDDIEKSLDKDNIECKGNNVTGKVSWSLSDSLYDEVPISSNTLKDNSETLNQIEEFVKTTSVDKKHVDKGVNNISKKSSRITKTIRYYKRKSPIKEVSGDLSESSDDDFMNSSNPKKEKRDEIKQDINQTYGKMLETKNIKIKKSNRNPTRIDKLKVNAGSNRRSMSIAESTFVGVSTRHSNRIISALPNTKLIQKDICDICKPGPGRKGKGQVPSSSQVPIVQAKQSTKAPTTSDKTSELMTSENERSDHTVPPKKRKYTKQEKKEKLINKVTEESTSVRHPRKKSSHDTDDQLGATSITRNRIRNQSVTSNCFSTERSKRKQKPKVVFTMLDDPLLECLIRRMGGSIVDTVDKCTVLMTGQVKRSLKLLQAIGKGKAICSPAWLHASKREHHFLDPWDYILDDKNAESKWKFSLKESLKRASTNKLLENYRFQILTTSAVDILKGAIEVCGGKFVTNCPSDRDGHFFVIASPHQKSKYARMIKQHPDIQIIEPEAIFDGVLRQELHFHRYLLQ